MAVINQAERERDEAREALRAIIRNAKTAENSNLTIEAVWAWNGAALIARKGLRRSGGEE